MPYDGPVSRTTHLGPRKALGQHWLTDRNALRRIAAAANFSAEDTVIEVGAGKGALTRWLAERATRLIAVEIDPRLTAKLRTAFAGRGNVTIVEKDVLEASLEELLESGGGLPYVVVGNLPYFIGSAIVRRFLEAPVRPRWLIVTLQEEVAESMAAAPGRMTYLSVEVQTRALPRILFHLPPRAFTPSPKVRSAVLRLDVLDAPDIEVDDRRAFLSLARAGFAAPRKRVRNSLAVGLRVTAPEAAAVLAEAGIDPDKRPAQLALAEWRQLYFAYRRYEAMARRA